MGYIGDLTCSHPLWGQCDVHAGPFLFFWGCVLLATIVCLLFVDGFIYKKYQSAVGVGIFIDKTTAGDFDAGCRPDPYRLDT